MNAQPTLTREHVVDELTALLGARRTLAMRRQRAYHRLAQRLLETKWAAQPRTMPAPTSSSLKTAA
jgi:hypothetical protein